MAFYQIPHILVEHFFTLQTGNVFIRFIDHDRVGVPVCDIDSVKGIFDDRAEPLVHIRVHVHRTASL